MKKSYLLLALISIFIFTCAQNDNTDKFYRFLGDKEAKVIQEAIVYFDQFLNENFTNEENKEDKVHKFLKYLYEHQLKPNIEWVFDNQRCKILIDEFENTGLRKEIWIYGYEIYDIDSSIIAYYNNYQEIFEEYSYKTVSRPVEFISFDSSFLINDSLLNAQFEADSIRFLNIWMPTPYSKLIVGLDKYKTDDSLIFHYTNFVLLHEDINPEILIEGLLNAEKKCYLNPFVDIVIIKELFYPIIYGRY